MLGFDKDEQSNDPLHLGDLNGNTIAFATINQSFNHSINHADKRPVNSSVKRSTCGGHLRVRVSAGPIFFRVDAVFFSFSRYSSIPSASSRHLRGVKGSSCVSPGTHLASCSRGLNHNLQHSHTTPTLSRQTNSLKHPFLLPTYVLTLSTADIRHSRLNSHVKSQGHLAGVDPVFVPP